MLNFDESQMDTNDFTKLGNYLTLDGWSKQIITEHGRCPHFTIYWYVNVSVLECTFYRIDSRQLTTTRCLVGMVYLYLAIFGARDTHITVVTVHYYFLIGRRSNNLRANHSHPTVILWVTLVQYDTHHPQETTTETEEDEAVKQLRPRAVYSGWFLLLAWI